MEFTKFTVTEDDSDRRIDRIVRRFLPKQPLSSVYKLMRKGLIRVDGKKVDPGFHPMRGSELWIARSLVPGDTGAQDPSGIDRARSPGESTDKDIGKIVANRVESGNPSPLALPEILLETKDLVFFNKPAGISVHGEGGLDRLIPQTTEAENSLSFRTGPLHRLDRDTTGILAFSRSLAGARWFSDAVRHHNLKKYYFGIALGIIECNAEWRDTADDGKEMITLVSPVAHCGSGESGKSLTLVRYRIITGRKHQIRIQGALHGHPLSGDSRYGPRKEISARTVSGGKKRSASYFLHARALAFPDDRPCGIPEMIIAPFPERFSAKIRELFGKDVLAQLEAGAVYWNQHEEHQ